MTDGTPPPSGGPGHSDFEAMSDAALQPQRNGRMGTKLLAVGFGIAAGIGAGKFIFKPKVTEAQLRQVEASAAKAQLGLKQLKSELEKVQKQYSGKICFRDSTDPDFEKARSLVIAGMSNSDLERLRGKEKEKTMAFLMENQRLWRVNSDTVTDRFDSNIGLESVGKYTGQWKITFPGEKSVSLDFDLDINGFQGSDEPNVLRYRDKDGTFKSTIEFRYRLLGTKSKGNAKRMHLVVDNAFKESRDQMLYFGIRFPSNLKNSQRARGKILGLTAEREWKIVGEYSITRK